MLELKQLETIQNTYQTTTDNIVREYAQHLFISSFYRTEGVENILFKGGTALRFAYRSPRFSEDFDFSASGVGFSDVEKIILNTLVDLTNQGLKCEIEESKETTGGYLAKLFVVIGAKRASVEIQISFRERKTAERDNLNIVNEYIPTYVANLLPEKELVGEKIQAALTRSKPRDCFDVYFLIRQGLVPVGEREGLRKLKEVLSRKEIKFSGELSLFLPRSMKQLAESFPEPLLSEIDKFF